MNKSKEIGNTYKVYLVGNAHIDPVWLWRWQEGFAEIKATFRAALDRMEEFPDFVFSCAGASYYKWIEDNCPGMFDEISERIKEGRWVIVGGWWLQPDCNIPSGESFARQGLYSQRYFLEKFEKSAVVGYNVDSFGHNGMLPQILNKSGMRFYVFGRPDENEKQLPTVFRWRSPDGSEVLTFRLVELYGGEGETSVRKTEKMMALADSGKVPMMCFYGVGNHGGGPTIDTLNRLEKKIQEFGKDRLEFSSPNEYFSAIADFENALPVVDEDLQHHASGCYSALTAIKALNRKAENRLIFAEKMAALAATLSGSEYRLERFGNAWKPTLFNQFHDILGGCSVKETYGDAYESYGHSLTIAAEEANDAMQHISWAIDTSKAGDARLSKENSWLLWDDGVRGTPMIVFNTLSWDIEAPVLVNKDIKGITDSLDEVQPVQRVRGSRLMEGQLYDALFLAHVPAMGYALYWLFPDAKKARIANPVRVKNYEMDNGIVSISINESTGFVESLCSGEFGKSVISGAGGRPLVIDDHDADTWAHGIFQFHEVEGCFADAKVSLLEEGELRSIVRVESSYNESRLRQDFLLYAGRSWIEVKVRVDWREKNRILKLAYSTCLTETSAVYEIPYGYITKPANGDEEPALMWAAINGRAHEAPASLAILNADKYSYDVHDNQISLTVLRSPVYAESEGEKYRDAFCDYIDQGVHEFRYGLLPFSSGIDPAAATAAAMELNNPVETLIESYHKGPLSATYKGIDISKTNIICTAFKKAEDGDGWILRCYESSGTETEVEIAVYCLGVHFHARFSRHEIKSFRLRKSYEVLEVNLIEF